MQAQVKYESEIKTAVLGDRTITVKNVTPHILAAGAGQTKPRN